MADKERVPATDHCVQGKWVALNLSRATSPESYLLLKAVLEGVSYNFRNISGDFNDGKICQIDTSLAEPEQVIKAYRTTSERVLRMVVSDRGDNLIFYPFPVRSKQYLLTRYVLWLLRSLLDPHHQSLVEIFLK